MPATWTVDVGETHVVFRCLESGACAETSRRAFERSTPRRLTRKLSMPTRRAAALYARFDVDRRIAAAGGDPRATPIVVNNRFAGWDFVARTMAADVQTSLDNMNSYVATAWFPAATQGELTILHDNVGEAITIACCDPEIVAATIAALFRRDADGARCGALLFGTFECVPLSIGDSRVVGARPGAFGALSVIFAVDDAAAIATEIDRHRSFYDRILV
jgi:hypothetical protein